VTAAVHGRRIGVIGMLGPSTGRRAGALGSSGRHEEEEEGVPWGPVATALDRGAGTPAAARWNPTPWVGSRGCAWAASGSSARRGLGDIEPVTLSAQLLRHLRLLR
jgi:hypothetical protein